jgi:hypothetical protein
MAKVTVVNKGATDWQVVTPAEKEFRFAREELQHYVQQMSGAALCVVEKEEGKPAFVLGLRDQLSTADRGLLPPAAKGYDGYAIAVTSGEGGRPPRIVIGASNGPGAIYAVYDLLERLGCRWFYAAEDPFDPEVVPRRPTLALACAKWAVASPMKYRVCNGSEWFFKMDYRKALTRLDWAMKNRYNFIGWQTDSNSLLKEQYERLRDAGLVWELERRGMSLHGPAHSFDQFLRNEDYFTSHPEWFGVRDGKRVRQQAFGAQFCWSNTEARRQFVENAGAFIRDAKAIRVFCTIPFDGGVACACDECRKAGASNLLVTIAGELADMTARVRPDAVVEMLGGYPPVQDPPTTGTLHRALRVAWAHWARYHGFGYDDPRYNKSNLESWHKAAPAGMTICQYYCDNFSEPWILPPFSIAMAGDRKYFLEKQIDGVYTLMYPEPCWWNQGLNAYLSGRLFYDVSLEPTQLMRDYAVQYFGKDTGRLLGRYYEEWARDPDLAYSLRGATKNKDRKMLAEQRRKYIDPAVRAAAGDSVLSYRVGKVDRLHAFAEKLADAFALRDEILELVKSGKRSEARKKLSKAKASADAVMAYVSELNDLNQGLMDKTVIGMLIKASVTNWIAEEEKKL